MEMLFGSFFAFGGVVILGLLWVRALQVLYAKKRSGRITTEEEIYLLLLEAVGLFAIFRLPFFAITTMQDLVGGAPMASPTIGLDKLSRDISGTVEKIVPYATQGALLLVLLITVIRAGLILLAKRKKSNQLVVLTESEKTK